jgi:hypothetical protein
MMVLFFGSNLMRLLFFMEPVCATIFWFEHDETTAFCMEPICATVFYQDCYHFYVSMKITVI